MVGEDRIVMTLRIEACVAPTDTGSCEYRHLEAGVELAVPIRLKHRHSAILISPPTGADEGSAVSRPLVRAVCLSRTWADQIGRGEFENVKALAKAQGLCEHYVAKLMPLARLAPDLVELILDGRQPRALLLGAITKHALPLDWDEQRALFARLA